MGKFFVQVGRVCRINYGPDLGKYVTIVDIVDANRLLVDGENFKRQVVPTKWATLTPIHFRVPRSVKTSTLLKYYAKYNISQKIQELASYKKSVAAKKRASLTDFERFKVHKLQVAKRIALNKALKTVKA